MVQIPNPNIFPEITEIDPSKNIIIKGARLHNLKNIDVVIPKNKLTVVTGVSGSGKSSLCIDTLFAEGQRRYVESLSSYARQFLNRMQKPDVDYIKGICPAIAIEQKVSTRTSRSTVGTLTEIYDYMRLLFARIGVTYSPVSGDVVKKHEVSDVIDFIEQEDDGKLIFIYFPQKTNGNLGLTLKNASTRGFVRAKIDNSIYKINEFLSDDPSAKPADIIYILVDRIVYKKGDEDLLNRMADSIQTAFYEGFGDCYVEIDDREAIQFSNRFELDDISFDKPTPHFFNFNNPYGACKICEGFGSIIGIDEELVLPDKTLSVYDGAIAPWRGEKMKRWLNNLLKVAHEFDFPIHRDYQYLTDKEKSLLWTGNKLFKGLNAFFQHLEEKSYKIQYRVMLSRYRGKQECPECKGSRIRNEASYVKICGHSIQDLLDMPVSDLIEFFADLKLSKHDLAIGKRILTEIDNRLKTMDDVGLGYLTLNRLSSTLSGGETQRINLTRSLGSNLTDSLYILDEPSVGLHPKDNARLIKVLKSLRDLGNAILVVEHDEEMMMSSDYLIDMGPFAGRHGGEVMFAGPSNEIEEASNSLTADYLTGKKEIHTPSKRRKGINKIYIHGASQFNLRNIDVTFPLNTLTVVTGVSGSGKTTLIKKILYPALKRLLEGYGERPGTHKSMEGDLKAIKSIELVNQDPLGRSSRSNPVTYVKAYDAIRDFYSKQQLAQVRGYKPKHFSFNVEGGRCELCKGEGEVVVEMQFLADIHLPCESCKGKRFKNEVLEITHRDKNIHDVLEMTVDDAISFFEKVDEIKRKLKPLQEIGLGYVQLGQSSSTLSGGEAQRVKLASFLGKGKSIDHVLFIFDEPTTGLHFHDIHKLLLAFNKLIDAGHSVVVIEHHMDVIKCADWIIDLGPEGGSEGGQLLYEGTPEGLVDVDSSYTGKYLKEKLI